MINPGSVPTTAVTIATHTIPHTTDTVISKTTTTLNLTTTTHVTHLRTATTVTVATTIAVLPAPRTELTTDVRQIDAISTTTGHAVIIDTVRTDPHAGLHTIGTTDVDPIIVKKLA
jgi:hypothetical protein